MGRWIAATLLAASLIGAGAQTAPAQAQTGSPSCPWMDPAKTPEQRADLLVGAMTLDQKLHATTFSEPQWFAHYGTAGHVDGVPSLCLPDIVMSDAGSGVVGLQQGTTIFPSGIAQAALWDPKMAQRFGIALGEEAFAKGINVMLGPGMNIARLATNGRNFEYMGEDPYLAGQTVASVIKGIQSNPVLAQAKHYVLNDQEYDRNTVNVHVDDRTLHEIYLAPFEAAVKQGHVGSLMCSYNLAFDHHVCESSKLLDGILRDQWGFDGFVTSDWGATHSTAPSALAGLDLEMHAAPPHYYGAALGDAIKAGQVPMARLDLMLERMYVPMFRFGLFDHPPVTQPQAYVDQADTPAHRALARELGEQSTVLLKNQDDLLPLDRGRQRTIAVVGTVASPPGAAGNSGGGGSSHGTGLPLVVSPLEGIQRMAQTRGDKVVYAATAADGAAVAKQADLAIVVIGDTESEGGDRSTLDANPGFCATLVCEPYGEDENALVKAVAAANKNTIVVVDAGAPVSMPWLENVKSVLYAWYSGVENGNAIASVIYGAANPSGKLPQTFPRSLADMPTRTKAQYPGINDQVTYSEKLEVGYRWFDAQKIEPLFPFGFGLSYTTFSFSGLKVKPSGDGATATFTVTNTGKRAGAEVGQVYVTFPSALGEPPRQLKGFRKVSLDPGEAARVSVPLDGRAFSYWDAARQDWRRARGCYGIAVGDSSRSLPLSGAVGIAGARCGAAARAACTTRRSLRVALRGVPRSHVRRVVVTVGGRRVATLRGARRSVAVRLARRVTGTVRVRLVITTTGGRRIVQRHTYRLCPAT